jgi:hypothetical protein
MDEQRVALRVEMRADERAALMVGQWDNGMVVMTVELMAVSMVEKKVGRKVVTTVEMMDA